MLIDGNRKSDKHFEVSDCQKQIIVNWCIKTAQKIDFKKIIRVNSDGSFSMCNDYSILKLILFFQNEFNFELNQDFLLNVLEFFEVEKSHQLSENFEKLINRIGDKKLVNDRIIKNLKESVLFTFSLSKHVEYALRENLIEVLPEIKNFFLNNNSAYVVEKNLKSTLSYVII